MQRNSYKAQLKRADDAWTDGEAFAECSGATFADAVRAAAKPKDEYDAAIKRAFAAIDKKVTK